MGNEGCARLLLRAGADANSRDESGWSPLHHAADRGHAECARLLVEAGADARARGSRGETAEELAKGRGYTGLASWLREASVAAEERERLAGFSGEAPAQRKTPGL